MWYESGFTGLVEDGEPEGSAGRPGRSRSAPAGAPEGGGVAGRGRVGRRRQLGGRRTGGSGGSGGSGGRRRRRGGRAIGRQRCNQYLLLAGANRDPGAFGCPHRFDAARDDASRHLSFGLGAHYCLGAPLGRLEAELAFVRFAQRVVGSRLVDAPPRYRPHVVLRGPESLPMRTKAILGRATP
ncbi:cytochrome P450 [Streptomyces nigra]|uniref:cytochrome P450 n=1 Tax=Streptomyces nigra TaxID=1827580 RepID=UPI00381F791E